MIDRRAALLAGLMGGSVATWRLAPQVLRRLLGLPSPRYEVERHYGLRVTMPDGIVLATDLLRPVGLEVAPTILIRTPYGRPGSRAGRMAGLVAGVLAGHGYNVVNQDCRGRFDSEGEWEPYVHEGPDGAATIAWILDQPWSDGQVATYGQSYVGYTQWAAALASDGRVRALVPSITQSFLADRDDGAYQLDRTLRWLLILDTMDRDDLGWREQMARTFHAARQEELLAPAYDHLPLATVDEALLGRPEPIFRRWLEYPDESHPYWRAVDLRDRIAGIEAPVHLVGGWYDIFIDGQLADYERLREAGRNPYLTVGPWPHMSLECRLETIRQSLIWYDAHLHGHRERLRALPVRVYVMGADEWREYPTWPPPSVERRLYLNERGFLFSQPPGIGSPADRYTFDPADPTPNLGGPLLATSAGPVDQRPLEARDDLLVYSTPPLAAPVEVIGPVTLELFVRSSLEYTDFVGRLCDVHPDGRSINLCEGHVRVAAGVGERQEDGTLRLSIRISSTAHRFRTGHRIRLHVASGAHPRLARNPGSDEPEHQATTLHVAEQRIYHDPTHPSALVLPLVEG